MFSCLSLTALSNHDMNLLHISSWASSFQHPEKQMIGPWWGSWLRSHHDPRQLQWSSRWHFRIGQRASSVTIQEHNGRVPIKGFFHVNTRKMSHGNWINACITRSFTSWASGGQYFFRGGGWPWASAAGIQECIRWSVWMVESAC